MLDPSEKFYFGARYVAVIGVVVSAAFMGVAVQQAIKSYANAPRQMKDVQIEKRRLRYLNVFVWSLILGEGIIGCVIYFDPLGKSYPRRQVYYTKYFFEFCRDIALTLLMIVFIIRALETNIRVAHRGEKLPRWVKTTFVVIGFINALSAFIFYGLSWLSRFSFFPNGRYLDNGTLRFHTMYLLIRDLVAMIGMGVTAHSIYTVRKSYMDSWNSVMASVGDEYQHKKAMRFSRKSLSIVIFCLTAIVLLSSDLIVVGPGTQRNFPLLCVNPSPWRLMFQLISVWVICGSIYFWLWTGCGCTMKGTVIVPVSTIEATATTTTSGHRNSRTASYSNPSRDDRQAKMSMADTKMQSVNSTDSDG